MSYELNGKIKVINEKQTFASGFEKQEFVVTTQEQYPQDVKFEAIKDKIDMLTGLQAGDEVTVSFNIRGNEYNGKYYVNLQAWRINKGAGGNMSTKSNESFPQDKAIKGNPSDYASSSNGNWPTDEPIKGSNADYEPDDLPF